MKTTFIKITGNRALQIGLALTAILLIVGIEHYVRSAMLCGIFLLFAITWLKRTQSTSSRERPDKLATTKFASIRKDFQNLADDLEILSGAMSELSRGNLTAKVRVESGKSEPSSIEYDDELGEMAGLLTSTVTGIIKAADEFNEHLDDAIVPGRGECARRHRASG